MSQVFNASLDSVWKLTETIEKAMEEGIRFLHDLTLYCCHLLYIGNVGNCFLWVCLLSLNQDIHYTTNLWKCQLNAESESRGKKTLITFTGFYKQLLSGNFVKRCIFVCIFSDMRALQTDDCILSNFTSVIRQLSDNNNLVITEVVSSTITLLYVAYSSHNNYVVN